jgi:hypothetical protein
MASLLSDWGTGGRRGSKSHEALSNRVLAWRHDLLFAKLQFPTDRAEPKSTKASDTGRLCEWELGTDNDHPRLVVKRVGEQRGDRSSREAFMHSQDTLIRSDLTTPWRGSAVRKDLEAKRPI